MTVRGPAQPLSAAQMQANVRAVTGLNLNFEEEKKMGAYDLGQPIVMMAAAALAEAEDARVTQAHLRDAEAVVNALVCDEPACSFFTGHDGDHSHEFAVEALNAQEYRDLLATLVDLVDNPVLQTLVKDAIEPEGETDD